MYKHCQANKVHTPTRPNIQDTRIYTAKSARHTHKHVQTHTPHVQTQPNQQVTLTNKTKLASICPNQQATGHTHNHS